MSEKMTLGQVRDTITPEQLDAMHNSAREVGE